MTPALPETSQTPAKAPQPWVAPDRHCATETPVATGNVGAATTSLVALLTRHVLSDGEVVIMILKPSFWFILLQSLRFIAAMVIVMLIMQINADRFRPTTVLRIGEFCIIAILARLMWATLHWMGRYYILTDLRIIRLAGVLGLEIFSCPLRRVARVRGVPTISERTVGSGSLEIIPLDESVPVGHWQTIPRPKQVLSEVLAAISRAKQGG